MDAGGPSADDVSVCSLLPEEDLAELSKLCGRCLYHTLRKAIRVHGTGERVFVATGDIDDMWIRDSSVQLGIYLPRMARRPALRRVLEGAIRTQAFYILQACSFS
jgi:meiotically up-regulated gene 157 (Mug157) protein